MPVVLPFVVLPFVVLPFVGPAALAALLSVMPCWTPPVDAPVTDPYRAPACTYCPGNRGIEFGPHAGQTVTAVESGVVSFAGSVAGTRYVVVDHADGLRATYGRLATIAVSSGQVVHAGQVVGTTTDRFYFGLRRGIDPNETSVDPMSMLGVRRYRSRLVPVDGTPPLPVGPGRLACGNTTAAR
ncbi:MAG: peptidase family protein [Ilumatobacteraceae bacterium]|nr:peptidase family protein [Ilumatobacteraceae bacterium]